MAKKRRRSYHHGNLRQALIDATLALVEEQGPAAATIRDAAKRAGVSSGAPFRHFPSRKALMTAVAEEAMGRLREEIAAALEKETSDDPLVRLRAVGSGYLRWAVRNPTHFQVISDRKLIDFEGSAALSRDNEALQALMAELLTEAQRRGLVPPHDVRTTVLLARATSYGLARMFVDGQFPSWGVAEAQAGRTMAAVMDLFIASLRKD
jgi:AcrR family transcriptional regulator